MDILNIRQDVAATITSQKEAEAVVVVRDAFQDTLAERLDACWHTVHCFTHRQDQRYWAITWYGWCRERGYIQYDWFLSTQCAVNAFNRMAIGQIEAARLIETLPAESRQATTARLRGLRVVGGGSLPQSPSDQ